MPRSTSLHPRSTLWATQWSRVHRASCIESLPRSTVDGRIGRQWWELEAEIRAMRAQGLANDVVVIQLGNNGSFTTLMFDGVMNSLAGTRLVLFVNVHAPVVWESEVNAMLVRNVNRYAENARLIDWYTASTPHPEYFIDDGTHLPGAGDGGVPLPDRERVTLAQLTLAEVFNFMSA